MTTKVPMTDQCMMVKQPKTTYKTLYGIHLHWPIKPNFFFRITLFILFILPMILFPDHVTSSTDLFFFCEPSFDPISPLGATLDPTVLTRQTLTESWPKPNPRSTFCIHSRSTLHLLGGGQTWPWANPKLMQSRPRADTKQTQVWGLPWCKVVSGQYCISTLLTATTIMFLWLLDPILTMNHLIHFVLHPIEFIPFEPV